MTIFLSENVTWNIFWKFGYLLEILKEKFRIKFLEQNVLYIYIYINNTLWNEFSISSLHRIHYEKKLIRNNFFFKFFCFSCIAFSHFSNFSTVAVIMKVVTAVCAALLEGYVKVGGAVINCVV